jgi:hypothetical protein
LVFAIGSSESEEIERILAFLALVRLFSVEGRNSCSNLKKRSMCVMIYTWRKDEFTSVRSGGEGVERGQEEEAQQEQPADAAAHNRAHRRSSSLRIWLIRLEFPRKREEEERDTGKAELIL